jgi:hypothetical protein
LSFPEAQRRLQQLSQWIGQPVTFNAVGHMMSVVRYSDLEEVEKSLTAVPDQTELTLLVSEKDEAAYLQLKTRHPAKNITLVVVKDLFSLESTINNQAFASAVQRILSRTLDKTLLALPSDLAFTEEEFLDLSPELRRLLIVTTLSDLLNKVPKAIPFDTLLRAAQALSRNA